MEEVPASETIRSRKEETQPLLSKAQGCADSSCGTGQTSALLPADRDKSLEKEAKLMDRDFTAIKEYEFTEATNCFSSALSSRLHIMENLLVNVSMQIIHVHCP